jgi:hypothetical protein
MDGWICADIIYVESKNTRLSSEKMATTTTTTAATARAHSGLSPRRAARRDLFVQAELRFLYGTSQSGKGDK